MDSFKLNLFIKQKKLCKIVFVRSSELRQISTDFDNFWPKDDNEAQIMRGAVILHLT